MYYRNRVNNQAASAFVEYAIILGVIAVVILTMNTYVKRGVQGKVKDMTDFFIGGAKDVQVSQVDPNVTTTSHSETNLDPTKTDLGSTYKTEILVGGDTKLKLMDKTHIEGNSQTLDTGRLSSKPDTMDFIADDAGPDTTLIRPEDNEVYNTDALEK
jgi:Flp pilus assembly pilin Flp